LGDLPPGGTATVSLPAPESGARASFFVLPVPGPRNTASDRLDNALGDYVRALSSPRSLAYGAAEAAGEYCYHTRSSEAILIGWSDQATLPGPVPELDGSTPPLQSANLVLIHIPVAVKPGGAAPSRATEGGRS
jgi:hypothetical protein